MIPRPRRNRVTPTGEIEATLYRGTLMGNRGDLHADDGSLSERRWCGKRWITCVLDPGGGPGVSFEAPGHYYPLFFFDEAVALAAGHRPCAQCRRTAFNGFVGAWHSVHGSESVVDIDRALHENRLEGRSQRKFQALLGDLPSGAFIAPEKAGEAPRLLWNGLLFPWSHAGYAAPSVCDRGQSVAVLTPRTIVAVLEAGYVPRPHLGEELANIDRQSLSDPYHYHQCGVPPTPLNAAQVRQVDLSIDG